MTDRVNLILVKNNNFKCWINSNKTIQMITNPHKLLISALLLVVANVACSDSETTSIDIDVTHNPYVNMIGTSVGESRTFSVAEIQPTSTTPIVSLGTLGFESNVEGDCSLAVSTVNDFKLLHTVTNVKLTRFRLRYKGKNLSRSQPVKTFPCNSALSSLNFMSVGIFNSNNSVVLAGVYQDVVTLTVTTQ
jgi:hypothetical protein